MALVDELKREIAELKLIALDGEKVTNEDLRTLKRTLEVMKDGVYLSIFSEVLDSRKEDVLEEIDAKIEKWTKEAESLEAEMDAVSVNMTSASAKRTRLLIEKIEEIKKAVEEVNYERLASSFVESKKNGQELVDSCSRSLALGYMDFLKFFGQYPVEAEDKVNYHGFSINKEVIDKIFKVVTNKPLLDEIRNIVEVDRKLAKTRYELLDINYVLGAYDFVLKNNTQVKEYISALVASIKLEEELERYKRNVQIATAHVNEYETANVFHKMTNLSKYKEISKNLVLFEERIAEIKDQIKKVQEQLKKLEIPIIGAGLEDLIIILKERLFCGDDKNVHFNYVLHGDSKLTSKEALAGVLFTGVNIENYKVKYTIAQDKKQMELEALEHEKETLESKKTQEASEYLEKEYTTCQRIVDLENAQIRYDKTPIICAYILKVLSDAKELPWQDIVDMVSSKENADELSQGYDQVIEEYMNRKMHEISKLETNHQETEEEERRRRML